MNTQFMMDYLSALSRNNNREWYHANKEDYKKANAEFEELLQTLILEIGKFDSSILHNNPGDLTFKLVRDARFSHDKSPYLPAFRAHISSKGKLPVPVGYYIVENGEEWERIIHDPEFEKYFTVQGTALKKVPVGYEKEHPQAEYLKFKSWYLEYPIEDEAF